MLLRIEQIIDGLYVLGKEEPTDEQDCDPQKYFGDELLIFKRGEPALT